ncbi:MAG: ATP-binding protein [bacterium]|nr:ATP-binding protein [bacterium]
MDKKTLPEPPQRGKNPPIFTEPVQGSDCSGDFYIKSVRLENVMGFESLSADFSTEAQTSHMFSLLLGDNSSGKTSFLRCLALGLCDKVSAAALSADFNGKIIRNGHPAGRIEIEVDGDKRFRIVTVINRINKVEDVEKEYYLLPEKGEAQPVEARDFPWDDLFVCGYGAGRVLGESREAYEQYLIKNAVGTLFRYDQPMQDPELSLRRLVSEGKRNAGDSANSETEDELLRRFLELIKSLFMFSGDERIELTGKGMEVVTAEGRSILKNHGDGYRNTSAWVLDFIAWNMLAGRPLIPSKMKGIVLVDGVEQHLHPKWQRHIIQLLRRQFPGVQFIVATHSPLCTSGITDLEENDYQVLRFFKAENEPVKMMKVLSLSGLRADQVLTSEAFDLPTTRNPKIAGELEAFRGLYLKENRNKKEEQRFQELTRMLQTKLPGTADTLETELNRERLAAMVKKIVESKDTAKGST